MKVSKEGYFVRIKEVSDTNRDQPYGWDEDGWPFFFLINCSWEYYTTTVGTIKARKTGTFFLLVLAGYYRDCFDGRRDDFQLTDLEVVRFSTCEISGFSIDLVGLCAGAVGYFASGHRRVHDGGIKKP